MLYSCLSLWFAVEIAKDINVTGLPGGDVPQQQKNHKHPSRSNLCRFFEAKVTSIISEVETSQEVYNGKLKIFSQNEMCMTTHDIIKCFDSIKNKNSEGFDRIP